MMGHRQKLAGDGEDALTRARRFYGWKSGTIAWIKRRYSRKARKDAKRALDGFANERM